MNGGMGGSGVGGSGVGGSGVAGTAGSGGSGGTSHATGGAAGQGAVPCDPSVPDCYPEIPNGWEGPVVLALYPELTPECPAEFPTTEELSFQTPHFPGTVNCECGACSGTAPALDCSAVTATVKSCALNGESWPMSVGQCLPLGHGYGIDIKLVDISTASGTCGDADVVAQTVDEPELLVAYRCGLPESCAGGGCELPDKPPSPYLTCIHRQLAGSDQEDCPAAYEIPMPFYPDIDDQRQCECPCKYDCGVAATGHNGSGETACDGPASASVSDSQCTPTGMNHLLLSAAEEASCTPRPNVTGGVVPVTTDFYCCIFE